MDKQLSLLPVQTSERSAPAEGGIAMWTAPYSAMRGGWYYRFYWMEGKRTRHLHIRGGNTTNAQAVANRAAVDEAIAQGKTPDEIRSLIRGWQHLSGNHKREIQPE